MKPLVAWWRDALSIRPAWMNAVMLFCAYLSIVYVPWDFFVKPVSADQEVWLGIILRGWAAKATEPIHWAVYAAGTYGFWRMRRWMWPWAALYAAQLTVGTAVWSIVYLGGFAGWLLGGVSTLAMGALTAALWRARDRFEGPRPSLRERYGEWALVTGASSGIGLEFARALAREGMSCVLTARREDRLRDLARDLERTHGVSTVVVSADLAASGDRQRLLDGLSSIEIGLLVNNAGVGYAGRFDRQDAKRLHDLVELNCVAPVLLTHHCVQGMRKRGRGAIVLTGSIAGHQPLPRLATYSASKGFDRLFGESLWAELRDTGVDVLVLEPGPTDTEFQDVAGEIPHPGEPASRVVEVALDALGRQPSVVSGWFNWARGVAVRLLPRSTAILIADGVTESLTPREMR